MKKRILLAVLALTMLFVLSGCVCEHQWMDANCLTPKTCSLCEETEGEPLGHDWLPAECTLPERCSRCEETVGEALGHTWVEADCVTPKTCSVCAETEGEALGHAWEEATCVLPKTCSVCAETEGEALGHTWEEATCVLPKTCFVCAETEVEALGHTWEEATCVLPKTCSVCAETEGEALGHTWEKATCVLPKTCFVCAETEGEALGHTWEEATCVLPKTCSVCAETEGEALGHTWEEATCVLPKTCSVCAETEGEALGHSWEEATCAAPETCSVCGETKGDSLPHTFGKLTIREEKMVQTCQVCQVEETLPLDYDAFLQNNLSGEWIAIMGMHKEKMYMLRTGIDQQYTAIYLNFLEDHQVQFYCDFSKPQYQLCTWALDEASLTDEDPSYRIVVSSQENSWRFEYTLIDNHLGVIVTPGVTPFDRCYLFVVDDFEPLAKSLSERQWVGFNNANEVFTIQFGEDFTFTGYQGGADVSGSWFMRDAYQTNYGNVEGDIVIAYQKDDQPCLVPLRIHCGGSSENLEEALKNPYSIQSFDYEIDYEPNHSDELLSGAAVQQMVAKVPEKLAGTWTSVYVRDYSNDDSVTINTTEYVLTMMSDGTYTINDALAGFYGWSTEGTWENDSLRLNYDGQLGGSLKLSPSGSDDVVYGNFGADEVTIYQNSINVTFAMMSEEEMATIEKATAEAKESLCGDWTSNCVGDYSGEESVETFTLDYTVSFLEDDTFVLNDAYAAFLGKEATGTWMVERVELADYSTSGVSVFGCLNFSDGSKIDFTQNDDSLSIYQNSVTCYLMKMTQEDIAAMLKADEVLIGEWTSVRIENTEEMSETNSFHITIAADGTFTANEPLAEALESVTGAWIPQEHQDGRYEYLFSMTDSGYRYMYDLFDNGELYIWYFISDDEWEQIVFVKD